MMMLAMVIATMVVLYVVFFDNKTGLTHNKKEIKTTIATVYTKAENATNFELGLLRRLHRRLRIRRGAVF